MSDTARRLVDAEWLHTGALARLLETLDRDGETARVVGGAVRNALLGEPIHEFDIATTALPPEVMRRAREAGFKAVPTGIEHGTITVVIDGRPFEVTTLREDVETFGRRAAVKFGRDWSADAMRRDFTMNALSVGRDGVVHDPAGGLADLAARRVRFIGDANRRIAEDYLRILRLFRFHAAYGRGPLDRDALSASIAGRAGLAQLSRERVRMELFKLLVVPDAAPSLEAMADAGLLVTLLGGVPDLVAFARMVEAEQAASLQADPTRRLAALAVRIAEDAERLGERLRLSNVERARLASMADGWWRIDPAAGRDAEVLLYRLGPDRYADRVLLAAARSASDAGWHNLIALPERWIAPVFPLKAADLIGRGLTPGPALGAALHAAESAWIAQGFPQDDAALAAIAESAVSGAVSI